MPKDLANDGCTCVSKTRFLLNALYFASPCTVYRALENIFSRSCIRKRAHSLDHNTVYFRRKEISGLLYFIMISEALGVICTTE